MDRALSERSLAKLLEALDPDARQAGEKYELLRQKLVKFFIWRGGVVPEDCADETIDRASRRLDQGEIVRNIASYCYGIAKLVVMEAQKRAERQRIALAEAEQLGAAADDGEADSARRCLERCLGRLEPPNRKVILGYYEGDRLLKIQGRRRLALELGISTEALRIRAHRVRARLELCVDDCMHPPSGAGAAK